MRMGRIHTALLTACSVSVSALLGCAVEDKSCAKVEGVYQPLYTPLPGGTCGPITNPNYVKLDSGRNGAPIMHVEKFPNADVTTEVVMKGCSVRITQKVEEHGYVRSRIDGDPIYIENANELTGTVDMMRWDETGQLACSGTYDAVFTKNIVTVGAAAQ